MALIEESIRRAQELGQLPADPDAEQLSFEVAAMLAEANALYLLRSDPAAFAMARRALDARLP
jgi:hypothetical protein